MAKKVYISEMFADAFYKVVVRKAHKLTTPQLYKELGHVQGLSETNCGWGEHEIRDAVAKYLKEQIREREKRANNASNTHKHKAEWKLNDGGGTDSIHEHH